MDTRIELNGVWKDYYDLLVAANEKEKLSDEVIGFLSEDRDAYACERASLLAEARANLASLTAVATDHLHGQQLLEHVRVEKAGLQRRCDALEAQRVWLEQQRADLRDRHAQQDHALDALRGVVADLERTLAVERQENASLLDITYRRDEAVEALERKVARKDEELGVLKKSLATKDRQFQTLLKERNRLRDELEILDKEARRGRRFPVYGDAPTPSTVAVPATPVAIGQTFPHFQRRMLTSPAALSSPGTDDDDGEEEEEEEEDGEEEDNEGEGGGEEVADAMVGRRGGGAPKGCPGTPASSARRGAALASTPSAAPSSTASGVTTGGSNGSTTVLDSPASALAADLSQLLFTTAGAGAGAGASVGVVDMKDKIYRSAIKKLHGELRAARKEIKTLQEQVEAATPQKGRFGVTGRKLFTPSPRKLF